MYVAAKHRCDPPNPTIALQPNAWKTVGQHESCLSAFKLGRPAQTRSHLMPIPNPDVKHCCYNQELAELAKGAD
jgi:hypothetical protein